MHCLNVLNTNVWLRYPLLRLRIPIPSQGLILFCSRMRPKKLIRHVTIVRNYRAVGKLNSELLGSPFFPGIWIQHDAAIAPVVQQFPPFTDPKWMSCFTILFPSYSLCFQGEGSINGGTQKIGTMEHPNLKWMRIGAIPMTWDTSKAIWGFPNIRLAPVIIHF